ncbi:YraN family protein [Paenibacillus spongiae]|uniref:UPF0102 protein L1F29_11930 n=1 Tax=Paenibacillus spongiae TaxID=2909671 RepID=A0ABY5SET1_9BACL|nr:YraN family protein [Paenibacillus spongiae]UVI32481.1 YraN family protein [Paenibacillus spongiae]
MNASSSSGKPDFRRAIGSLGETYAADRLTDEGFAILHRNWRCRSGELDIVAEHRGTLVFIEVRTRTAGGRFGTAAESVDPRKRRQVRSIAEIYMQAFQYRRMPARFDVIAITIERKSNAIIEYKHLQGAF